MTIHRHIQHHIQRHIKSHIREHIKNISERRTLKTQRSKRLSAEKLTKRVSLTQLKNSENVAVVSCKISKSKPLIKITTATLLNNGVERKHIVEISAALSTYKGKLSKCEAIKVNCDCLDYAYTFNVSNAIYGSAELIYEADAPLKKNPSLRPGCCKHILKALLYIIENKL